MSNDLVIKHNIDTLTLGKMIAQSGYFSDAKEAAQAIVKVLAGQELGFGPVASMVGIHIIQGKPAISANLMAAAVIRRWRWLLQRRGSLSLACWMGIARTVSCFGGDMGAVRLTSCRRLRRLARGTM